MRLLPSLLLLLGVLAALSACQEPAAAPDIQRSPSPTASGPTSATVGPPQDSPVEQERTTRRLDAGELLLAADDDAIPALFLDDTVFVDVTAGNQEWRADDRVIGVEINGDARAYPVRLMSLHEIANDTIGGRPVAVTWCPLCFTAIVFDRVVEGLGAPRELTFGVSGFLYRNNLVMYDHQTNTLWSQVLGEALRGAQRGTQLNFYGSSLSTWSEWQAAYPETRIVSAESLSLRADEIVDPYAGYYSSGAAGFDTGAERDSTLPAKQLVAGLVLGGDARAYDLATLADQTVVNDTVADTPVAVLYDRAFSTAHTYRRTLDNQTVTFDAATPGTVVDRETGSQWDIRSGEAVSGPLAGQRLDRLSAPLVFWFAWTDIYPQSDVYNPTQ